MRWTDELGAWAARQRWYAGKSHEPRFRLIDQQPVPGATRFLVMDDAGERPTLYQVPISARDESNGSVPEDARIAEQDDALLVDAARESDFTLGILTEMGIDAGGVTGSRVLSGEQSNTSIVYDVSGRPEIIVKLFRTLHHGENPDVTVQRVLSEWGSPFVARFYGSLDADWPDVGRPTGTSRGTVAFAQEFLAGARDGWEAALGAARVAEDFTESARDLGIAVAGVHVALAEALPTVSTTDADVDAISGAWRRRLRIACAEVPAVAERSDAITDAYAEARGRPWPDLQRIHGDLHLGQVLSVPDGGWRLVDFEGEPLRPMAERTAPDLPPRDVAGMLRSFDYAAAVGEGPQPAAWAAACRSAFLDGYAMGSSAALDPVLLRALVLDKAVYESIYEARNRPAWLPVPLSGIDTELA